MSTFCQRSYHTKCQRRGVGGQKKPKSCQRSLWSKSKVKQLACLSPLKDFSGFIKVQVSHSLSTNLILFSKVSIRSILFYTDYVLRVNLELIRANFKALIDEILWRLTKDLRARFSVGPKIAIFAKLWRIFTGKWRTFISLW